MLPRRATATAALTLLLPLALTGCGKTERSQANPEHAKPVDLPSLRPTVYPSRTPSASAEPTATGSATPTAEPTTPAGKPGEVQATADNKFVPATISIKAGESVTWVNPGGFHSVTGGTGAAAKDAASPMQQPTGQWSSYKATFPKAGSYPYYCEPHEALGMKGTVTVT